MESLLNLAFFLLVWLVWAAWLGRGRGGGAPGARRPGTQPPTVRTERAGIPHQTSPEAAREEEEPTPPEPLPPYLEPGEESAPRVPSVAAPVRMALPGRPRPPGGAGPPGAVTGRVDAVNHPFQGLPAWAAAVVQAEVLGPPRARRPYHPPRGGPC